MTAATQTTSVSTAADVDGWVDPAFHVFTAGIGTWCDEHHHHDQALAPAAANHTASEASRELQGSLGTDQVVDWAQHINDRSSRPGPPGVPVSIGAAGARACWTTAKEPCP